MSVRKREWKTASGVEKETWVVDYTDQFGVRRLKTFRKKRESDAFESRMRGEVREGTHVADSATVAVAEAAKNWLESCRAAELERATLAQYQQHVDLHIVPFIGRTKLSQLGVPAVRAFQDRLRAGDYSLDENDPRREPRSAAMLKRVTGSLGALLADSQERGLVSRNAVREMSKGRRRGKARQGERRRKAKLEVGVDIPTPAEAAAIIHAARDRWRPLLITAIYTGLRASELRGLRWSDVDLKALPALIHVRQRADRYNKIGPPKSDDAKRSVPIGPIVANTLREWKLKCAKGKLDLVFPNSEGNIEWHANIVNRGLVPTQIAAGVTVETGEKDDDGHPLFAAKYSGLHALRHFFASWCINAEKDGGRGLPAKRVQELMGHSSITITMDTYGHLFPAADDDALAAAENKLLASVNAT